MTDGPAPEAEHYVRAAASGSLALQRCTTCGGCQFYPRVLCRHCRARTLVWEVVSPTGRLLSWTVIERAVSDVFRGAVPYAPALVEVDAGPQLLGWMVARPGRQAAIGDRVDVWFDGDVGLGFLRFGLRDD